MTGHAHCHSPQRSAPAVHRDDAVREAAVGEGESGPCELGQPHMTAEEELAHFQMDEVDVRSADIDREEQSDKEAVRGANMVLMQGGSLGVEVVDARVAVYNSGLGLSVVPTDLGHLEALADVHTETGWDESRDVPARGETCAVVASLLPLSKLAPCPLAHGVPVQAVGLSRIYIGRHKGMVSSPFVQGYAPWTEAAGRRLCARMPPRVEQCPSVGAACCHTAVLTDQGADQQTSFLPLAECRKVQMDGVGDSLVVCRIVVDQESSRTVHEATVQHSLEGRTVSGDQGFEVGGTEDIQMMQSAFAAKHAWEDRSRGLRTGVAREASNVEEAVVNHGKLAVVRQAWKKSTWSCSQRCFLTW